MDIVITLIGAAGLALYGWRILVQKTPLNGPADLLLLITSAIALVFYNTGYRYSHLPASTTWVLYLGVILLIFLSTKFGQRTTEATVDENTEPLSRSIKYFSWGLLFLGVLGTFCLVLVYGPILVSSDLDTLRQIVYEGSEGGNILTRIGRMSSMAHLGFGIYRLRRKQYSGIEGQLFTAITAASAVLQSLLTAGRWPLLIFAIVLLMSVKLTVKSLTQNAGYVGLITLFLGAYVVGLPLLRTQRQDSVEQFSKVFEFTLVGKGTTLIGKAPDAIAGAYLNVSTYLTQGISYLDRFLKEKKHTPKYGALHFAWLARLSGLKSWNDYANVKEDLREDLALDRKFAEIWATGLREPFFDFGYVGGTLALVLTGLFIGRMYNPVVEGRATVSSTMIYVSLITLYLFIPITSPIENSTQMNLLNNTILLYLPIKLLEMVSATAQKRRNTKTP